MDFDFDRLSRSPFAAGALGSLVALKFAPGSTWAERVFNVVAGAATSGYASPAVAEWLNVTSPGVQAGLSFGVGMFGLSLAAAVIDGIRALKVAEILDTWFRRRG